MAEAQGQVPGAPSSSTVREVETKTTRLPLFYGVTPGVRNEVTPKALISRIEAYCRSTNKPANTECQELYLTLRADALGWWDSLKHSTIDKGNWAQLKRQFISDYDYRISNSSTYRIQTLKQKIGEGVVTFFSRVSQAVDDMYNGMPLETNRDRVESREETILHTHKNLFVSGLRENLRAAVLNHPIPTLDEAKEQAKKAECLAGAERPKPTATMWEEVASIMDTVIEVDNRGDEDDDFHEEEVMAINNWRQRHNRRPVKWTPRRRTQSSGPFTGKCHNCDKTGHIARNCREPRRNLPIRAMDDRPGQGQDPPANPNPTPNPHYGLSSIKNW